MQTDNIYIVHPATQEQADALKAFVKALKIKFEIASTSQTFYNPDFVAKIKESKREFEKGAYKRVDKKDLQQFLGLP